MRAIVGCHVRLRPGGITALSAQYHGLQEETLWEVVHVDGGYGRDGLWLRGPDGRLVLAWRCQVAPEPRCQACGAEGHTSSRGTAKTCAARVEEVAESRKRASQRMREHWRAKKAGELPVEGPVAVAIVVGGTGHSDAGLPF